jgi:hypothetical protein
LLAVIGALSGNANFPNPPVDLAVFKAAVDHYSALCADYVEGKCKDDMAVFSSSGFVPQSSTRNSAPQPLSQPGRGVVLIPLPDPVIVPVQTSKVCNLIGYENLPGDAPMVPG